MNKEIEAIRALVELGDKATPGEWKPTLSDDDWELHGTVHVFSQEDGHSVCTDTLPPTPAPEELTRVRRDFAFIAAAANARPALRAMLARLDKLEGALKEIATHDHGSPERYEGSNTGDAETYGYDLASHAIGSIAAAALKEAHDA